MSKLSYEYRLRAFCWESGSVSSNTFGALIHTIDECVKAGVLALIEDSTDYCRFYATVYNKYVSTVTGKRYNLMYHVRTPDYLKDFDCEFAFTEDQD
ncbi:hypothetical protein FDJ58_gp155 [Bacillus phage SIOphi]|uniref:Uncharacterized protein n=1 Tax=Bacillus phage SIOphi TaxID=1285382 RepID=R4JF39_9CAUD|nr:hypothetical protein FDJ58_gp155 [Bacillus phage SIOphi]AGK86963.1 hypothetical protein SIOphi_00775 [Bacillus phage SIOphi]